MRAAKCDRCDAFYEPQGGTGDRKDQTGTARVVLYEALHVETDSVSESATEYDLCPKCSDGLYLYLDQRYEVHP